MRPLLTRCMQSGLILFALGAVLPVQVQAETPKSLLLRYHWVVGTTTRQVETDTITQTWKYTPPTGKPGPTIVQRADSTQTVRKVYADGSGLIRLTFSGATTTQGNKRTNVSLVGYAIDQRISPRGLVLSQQILGKAPSPDSVASGVTSAIPTAYPAAAAAIGSVWHQTISISTFPTYPTIHVVITYRVLALGSWHGQPTMTVRTTIDQPAHFTGVLGTMKLRYQATGTETVVIGTGVLTGPAHIVFTVPITITNAQSHGIVRTVIYEVVKPMP